jgi:hypothetical protein
MMKIKDMLDRLDGISFSISSKTIADMLKKKDDKQACYSCKYSDISTDKMLCLYNQDYVVEVFPDYGKDCQSYERRK